MSEFSAKYWRNRAAATAAMADRRWIDERQKFKLLRVAREYDKLADAAAAKGQPEADRLDPLLKADRCRTANYRSHSPKLTLTN
ncbi:hypothetical protein [Bradyrhizobium sp. URHC0002]|jgi:hypothetical protein